MYIVKHQRNNRTLIQLVVSAMSLLLAIALPVLSQEEKTMPHPSHPTSQQQRMKIPETAKDHYDLAERYKQKAEEYRQEVAMHREMLAEYSKEVAQIPKAIGENPYVKKMRLHCEKYIKAAGELAQDAEEMAKFHIFRARELEGDHPDKKDHTGSDEGDVQSATVELTERGYDPKSLRLKRGIPVRLTFIRKTDDTCGMEVVIPEWNLKRDLPLNEPVVLEFRPDKSGEFSFACGMGMLHGSIVVGGKGIY